MRWKETLGEDAVKIFKMTTNDVKCYINLVNKAVVGFERTDSNFENSFVGKVLSNSGTCYREIICERKSQLMKPTSLLSDFLQLPQPYQP